METFSTDELVVRYNKGLATPSEIALLEKCLKEGEVQLAELNDLSILENSIAKISDPIVPVSLDARFYSMLAAEKNKATRFNFSIPIPSLSAFLPRLAFSLVILALGFGAGYWLNKPATSNDQVQALSQQVDNLQEMVMLSLLEKESASERLRAVSLTSEMDQASKKVTSALIATLNNDTNINVRLAALDALRPYTGDNNVRAELIRSISKQESPMLQVAMAEFMCDIQERKSVTEFNKILKGNKTPEEVKNRIKEKIQVLI